MTARTAARPMILAAAALLVGGLSPRVLEAGAPEAEKSTFDQGLASYRQNQLDEARDLFEGAVDEDPANADAWSYLAETLGRLHRLRLAELAARQALRIDPCHAFARTVLANLYSPQYVSVSNASADSTWHHLMAAIDCDPDDGGAWLSIWTEGMRRGDTEREKRALRILAESGFLSPAALDYGKWMLAHLPEGAILLTNGDMDTYPPLAVQVASKYRPDVGIVNLSLLNLKWYARLVCERYQIPLPFGEEEFEDLTPHYDEEKQLVLISTAVVRGWLDLVAKDAFPRPLAFATTVADVDVQPGTRESLVQCGCFWLVSPQEPASPVDTRQFAACMAAADRLDFTGSFTSPQDRSPVRISSSDRLISNVARPALVLANYYVENGRTEEALRMVQWAEDVENESRAGPIDQEMFEALRKSARHEAGEDG